MTTQIEAINPKDLIHCPHCDCQVPYSKQESGPHLSAYCRNCTKFIKNLPKVPLDERKDFVFYFGKYRDIPLSQFNTPEMISWLRWIITTNSIKQWQKELIIKHIND